MKTLRDLLDHHKAYDERLYLIPSENSPSIAARTAFLTDLLNRYCFPAHATRRWAFPGTEFNERIRARCAALLKKQTGAEFVTIKPISGVSAMTIALAGLLASGQRVATIAPENGGHSITRRIAERLGIHVSYLPYNNDRFSIDTAALPGFISSERPDLIYLDQCHILFPQPLSAVHAAARDIPIYYDGSHVMGLIFGGQFGEPLQSGATFLGGSTHKTIPGPHKAFIATNDSVAARRVADASNYLVSHDHGADVAALTIVLEEMDSRWDDYAAGVVRNAKHFAHRLVETGFSVLGAARDYTESHQVWIDTHPHLDAFDVVQLLARANIMTNTFEAPSLTRLGVRIGVQELTYRGATEETFDRIVELFAALLHNQRTPEECRSDTADIARTLRLPVDEALLEQVRAALKG